MKKKNILIIGVVAFVLVLAVGFVFMFLAKGRKNDEKV